eukprot:g5138.t1
MNANMDESEGFRACDFGKAARNDREELAKSGGICGASPQFCDNRIKTSFYTWYDFFPKSLFGQFRRLANAYFLVVTVLMTIGTYSSLYPSSSNPFTTLAPLTVIVFITMTMEARDDIGRHAADNETDARSAQTVERTTIWRDIAVGDVLIVRNKELVPADIVILATSEEDGVCYVETSSIDGETNLKIRSAPSTLDSMITEAGREDLDEAIARASALAGRVVTEVPNNSINTFSGTLKHLSLGAGSNRREIHDISLGAKQLALRGCAVRNTNWLLGLVVYTGEDTKVARNSQKKPVKMSNIDLTMNALIKRIIVVQCVLVFITLLLQWAWQKAFFEGEFTLEDYWYLFPTGEKISFDLPDFFAYFFTFFIVYCMFVPISLYVSVEMVNQYHARFVDKDARMWDPESDTPAKARTANLCSELGQVQYIFTDKTGTLTQNVMEFKQCSIGGRIFGIMDEKRKGFYDPELSEILESTKTTKLKQDAQLFLLNMSINHTVVAESDKDAHFGIAYQAESPDEGALADGAAMLGYRFVDRTATSIFIEDDSLMKKQDVDADPRVEYDILAINAFNSTRKRSSMVVKTPDGKYLLLVKGADNVMLDRSVKGPGGYPQLAEHLTEFSKKGLRTLVFGYRVLKKNEVNKWLEKYSQAACSLQDRSKKLMEVAELIEGSQGDQFIEIVGASAIEDKLQVGVGDTIATCHRAGIKLWVLTGDKMETAINIGYSCRVLRQDGMKILKMRHDPKASTVENAKNIQSDIEKIVKQIRKLKRDAAEKRLARKKTMSFAGLQNDSDSFSSSDISHLRDPLLLEKMDIDNLALVITGPALTYILDDDVLRGMLLEIGQETKVVIACRVSPLQKALLVRMVKKGVSPTPITLAIGDGANDCSMIQEAHVGIGISGKEGLQAANSADFSIAQFRFLKRLLLIHGRWDYRRVSKTINYTLYKSVVMTLTLFMYNFFSGFSGTLLYEGWMYSGYNCFLFAGPIAIGIFDKDVRESTVMMHPELYVTGRRQMDLNKQKLIENVMLAFWHGSIIMLFPALGYASFDDGSVNGMLFVSTVVFSCLFWVMLYRNCFLFWTVNKYAIHSILVSIFLFFLFFVLYGMFFSIYMNPAFYYVPIYCMMEPTYWLVVIGVTGTAVLGDLALTYAQITFFPNLMDLCQELDHTDEMARRSKGGGDRRSLFSEELSDVILAMENELGENFDDRGFSVSEESFKNLSSATTSHDPSCIRSRQTSRGSKDHSIHSQIGLDLSDRSGSVVIKKLERAKSMNEKELQRVESKRRVLRSSIRKVLHSNRLNFNQVPQGSEILDVSSESKSHKGKKGLQRSKSKLKDIESEKRKVRATHFSGLYHNRPDPFNQFLQQTLPSFQLLYTPAIISRILLIVAVLTGLSGTIMFGRDESTRRYMVQYEGKVWGNLYPDYAHQYNWWGSESIWECSMNNTYFHEGPEANNAKMGYKPPIVENEDDNNQNGSNINLGAREATKPGETVTCSVDMFIGEKMEAPMYLLYFMDNFHQNYQTYYSSVDRYQLLGSTTTTYDEYSGYCNTPSFMYYNIGLNARQSLGAPNPLPARDDCDIGTTVSDENGVKKTCQYLEPCGLMANTFFNDTFIVKPLNVQKEKNSCDCIPEQKELKDEDGKVIQQAREQ